MGKLDDHGGDLGLSRFNRTPSPAPRLRAQPSRSFRFYGVLALAILIIGTLGSGRQLRIFLNNKTFAAVVPNFTAIDFSGPPFVPSPRRTKFTAMAVRSLVDQKADSDSLHAVEVVRTYEMCVNNDDALAMVLLGDCYRIGYGVSLDLEKAIEYYRMAMDRGNLDGQYNYAWMLAQSQRRFPEWSSIQDLVQDAARHGHRLAQVWVAAVLEKNGETKRAMDLLQNAAGNGNVLAKIRYARMLVGLPDINLAVRQLQSIPEIPELRENGTGVIREEYKEVVMRIYQQAMLQKDAIQAQWLRFVRDLGFDGQWNSRLE
jgi:hypothetical protein